MSARAAISRCAATTTSTRCRSRRPRSRGDEVVNNSAAALPASLPYQPLAWSAITMYVDPRPTRWRRSMATMQRCKLCRRVEALQLYPPAGAVLALVTWVQRDDPHWFGARIPARPRSVEFVQCLEGSNPAIGDLGCGAHVSSASVAAQRADFVPGLAPTPLP